ncbi:DUF2076 domain-containing protein [Azospirillum brasilense]|uniref:DUF2076 domain-containing protein n=1 Tax=Azospirillum brasilense TaxID=192 RepID=UPI000E676D09|nr:DUF2076 domain-containing protein [Azospirillum brasilense]NUB26217.1 DUF2076 family protein [Azospirillum brasilense]NUB30244.1 DUF2076 family protein [Azospirillum brasilense]RIW06952.1 DUF2076 family protein [Azospirillum brasilense]
MTPEERTLLSDLFTHLREVENQPRDPEAERFIQQMIQSQPAAAYYMAQSVLVQQQALTAAQQRIDDLERQVREAQSRAQQTQTQPSGGSFLSNALGLGRSPWAGGGSSRPAEQRPAPMPPSPQGPAYNPMQPPMQSPGAPSRSPWGAAPQAGGQPGYGQPAYPPQPGFGPQGYAPRGGGFLSGAAQTAAGVAGGMLAASAISSMLSHSPGPFGEAAAAAGQTASHGETIINNYYGDSADQGADQGLPPEDNNLQNVDYQTDDSSFDDGGDDGGGDDSWI